MRKRRCGGEGREQGKWPYLTAWSGWASDRRCHLDKGLKGGRELASRKHSRRKEQQRRGPKAEAGVLCKQTQVAAVGWPRRVTENPGALRRAWIFGEVWGLSSLGGIFPAGTGRALVSVRHFTGGLDAFCHVTILPAPCRWSSWSMLHKCLSRPVSYFSQTVSESLRQAWLSVASPRPAGGCGILPLTKLTAV